MRYYHFENGKVKGHYAVPQPGIDTQLLPEQLSPHHQWNGNDWVLNQASLDAENAYKQKHVDAIPQLRLNDLANKTYAQVDTYIKNQVTDLASAKTVLKRFGKIILAMLKHGDFSN